MINKNPVELIAVTAQELSLARDLDTLMFIVRKSARKLTSADGVTFVLKDKDNCFYADEDAIMPLWKGQRFPASACISGWAIMNKQHVVVKNIYDDERIPHAVYKPTFVKSLAMMPIRRVEPVGAIGCYWSEEYTPSEEELTYLQAIADIACVAFEKLQIYSYLSEKMGDTMVNSHHTADILFSPHKFLARIATF